MKISKIEIRPPEMSFPDIDVDFGTNLETGFNKENVIDYLIEKYGRNYVSMIGNRLIYQGKSAIRDLSQVYDIPTVESQIASKEYINTLTVEENIIRSENVKNFFGKYPFLKNKVSQLVGTVSSLGIHAGGVVISDPNRGYALNKYCALQRPAEDGRIATLWTKKEVEQIGLIKYDLLGLSAASIIHHNKEILGLDPYEDCPEEDEVFENIVLNKKHKNIFQFESPLGKKAFEDFMPTSIMELANASGIIRVVGSEAGREIYETYKENVSYYQSGDDNFWKDSLREQIFEDRNYEISKKVLEESYGVLIYQEQLASLVKEFSDGEKNFVDGDKKVRKLLDKLGDTGSLSEKQGNPEALKKWHDEFMSIMGEYVLPYIGRDGWTNPNRDVQRFLYFDLNNDNTLPAPKNGIIGWFISAAAYLFSKLHSITYSTNTYNMMWLKYHYPLEFWTTSLIADQNEAEKVKNYISAIKAEEDITILSPCVNNSEYNFTFNKNKKEILYGLNGIVGFDKAAQKIIDERNANGKYKDIADFVIRTKSRTVTKKTLTILFCVGAFDCFGDHKEVYEKLIHAQKINPIDITNEEELLLMEDKYLGVNIKYTHPLLESAHFYDNLTDIEEQQRRQIVSKILKIYNKVTRTGKPYKMLRIQCLNCFEIGNIFVWDIDLVEALDMKEGKIMILNIKKSNDFYQLAMGKK